MCIMNTFTVSETKICVCPTREKNMTLHYCQGNRGTFYTFDEELYDGHFPVEWLAKHRELRVGPSYCNVCRKNAWNGVFFGYCIHCAWVSFRGERGRGILTPGNEASVQYLHSLMGDSPDYHASTSVFDTYMRGVTLDQIGDTDLCNSMAMYLDVVIEQARDQRASPQIVEAAIARMEQKKQEDDADDDFMEFSDMEDDDVDDVDDDSELILHFTGDSGKGGAGGAYYSYHGQFYTKQFPESWLISDQYFETGPEFCNGCREQGRWNGVCIGYCVECAGVYHGKRGTGFIFPGCETTTLLLPIPQEEECDVFAELDENSAFNTYLIGYQLHELGDLRLEDTWKQHETVFHQMNDTIKSPEIQWRIRHETQKNK